MNVLYPAEYNKADRLIGHVISDIKANGEVSKYLIKTHDNKYIQVPASECIKLND